MKKLELQISVLNKELEKEKRDNLGFNLRLAEEKEKFNNEFKKLKAERDEKERLNNIYLCEGNQLTAKYNELCRLYNNQKSSYDFLLLSKVYILSKIMFFKIRVNLNLFPNRIIFNRC